MREVRDAMVIYHLATIDGANHMNACQAIYDKAFEDGRRKGREEMINPVDSCALLGKPRVDPVGWMAEGKTNG